MSFLILSPVSFFKISLTSSGVISGRSSNSLLSLLILSPALFISFNCSSVNLRTSLLGSLIASLNLYLRAVLARFKSFFSSSDTLGSLSCSSILAISSVDSTTALSASLERNCDAAFLADLPPPAVTPPPTAPCRKVSRASSLQNSPTFSAASSKLHFPAKPSLKDSTTP